MSARETVDDEEDLAGEAADFVRAARALVAWHDEAGSVGFPRGEPRARAAPPPALVAAPARVADARDAPEPTATQPSAPRVAPPPATPDERGPMPSVVVAPVAVDAPAEVLDQTERVRRLALVEERVQACVACGLHAKRSRTVFSRGSVMAELVFVGEGPGEEEDRQGLPFVGKAGQLLDKMIQAMGYGRDDVYVCNVVKCRPPENRTPEPSEMATCLPFLNEQLDLVRPKAIVALGGTALKGLMGPSEGITKARGSWRLYRGRIPLMPTFHPAYILRQSTREVKAQVWSDLQQVLQRLGRKAPPRGAD